MRSYWFLIFALVIFPVYAAQDVCQTVEDPNGKVSYSSENNEQDQIVEGTVAVLSCDDRFQSNTVSSTCVDGVWEPELAPCVINFEISGRFKRQSNTAPCLPIGVPFNGRLAYSGNANSSNQMTHESGTQVTLTCDNGVNANGAALATCTNGVWQPFTLGYCSTIPSIKCLGMIPPMGGDVTYSSQPEIGLYTNGTTATVKCNSKPSSATSVCNDGVWNPSVFTACL